METYEPGPEPQPADGRLIGAVRRMLSTFVAVAHTRAELLTTEIQEEIHRAASVMLYSFVAVLFGTLSILMIGLTLIIAFPQEHRLLVAILVTATFLAVTIGTALLARAKVRAKDRFLSATLDELKRDRATVDSMQ